jgi:glycosyltransferase 2 family protein
VIRIAGGAAAVACAGVLLLRVFGGVDAHAVLAALGHAGHLAPLAVLPFMAGMAADAAGMQVLLGALRRRVPLALLLPVRVATEALHMTAPAGFVVADTATAALLDARGGVPLGEGAVLAVARKWLVMRAHAIYITLGALVGAATLEVISEHLLGHRWTALAISLGLALVPLGLSSVLGLGFRGGATLARIQRVAERLPIPALRERVQRLHAGACTGDALLERVGSARGVAGPATLAFLCCWVAEAVDTAVVLWLVTGRFDLPLAFAVETGVSILRSIANVAPAGIGVQEAGYAGLLIATGVGADAAAAFVVLKRCKELFWIVAGYGMLAGLRGQRPAERRLRDRERTATAMRFSSAVSTSSTSTVP